MDDFVTLVLATVALFIMFLAVAGGVIWAAIFLGISLLITGIALGTAVGLTIAAVLLLIKGS